MASLPIPFLSDLQLPIPGRARPAKPADVDDPAADLVSADHDHTDSRVIVGGRHGSPSIVVGLPLADITVQERDPATTAAVTELAGLVAALAEQVARLVPGTADDDADAAAEGAAEGAGGATAVTRPTPAAGVDPAVVEEVRSRALALQRTLLATT